MLMEVEEAHGTRAGGHEGRRAGLKTVQRCKPERSSCAKVQKWRDGVAGDKLARGHVGKELTSGGPEAQRLRGPEHGQLNGEPEIGGSAGKLIPGLGSQPSGAWFRCSGSGAGTDFTRRPHLYLITRTRYLRAETWDPKMFSLR